MKNKYKTEVRTMLDELKSDPYQNETPKAGLGNVEANDSDVGVEYVVCAMCASILRVLCNFLVLVDVVRAGFLAGSHNHGNHPVSKAAHQNTSIGGSHVREHINPSRASESDALSPSNSTSAKSTQLIPHMQEAERGRKKLASESNAGANSSVTMLKNNRESFSAYVRNAPAAPTGSVIFLDSWNAQPGWLYDWLLDDFDRLVAQRCRIIEAVGRMYYDPEGNYRAWYAYADWHNEIPVEPDVDQAVAYVHSLLQQEFNILYDYNKIILAGYSQGAVLAIEASIRFPQPLGLVFSERGVLFESRTNNPHSVVHSPYVMTGGSDDTTYYIDRIKMDCRFLLDLNVPTFLKEFPSLDHFGRSQRENDLAIRSFGAVLSQPGNSQAVAHLEAWTDC